MKEVIIYSPNVLVKFTLEMYVSMMAILTCYFTDFRCKTQIDDHPIIQVIPQISMRFQWHRHLYLRSIKFSNRRSILKSMSFLKFLNRRPILKSMSVSHFLQSTSNDATRVCFK
jgi:hypothetical protein